MAEWRLLISCEHGGNSIPVAYQPMFTGQDALIASHRGYDPGALELARLAADRFQAPLLAATTSRLLVDLNRSRGSRSLFSEISGKLAPEEREQLLAEYYAPYRDNAENTVRRLINAGHSVLHLACHTFTPVLGGRVRTMDVGLLYDPANVAERRLCICWQKEMAGHFPAYVVRRNAPYRGVSDCLATALRVLFPRRYLGIELEVNHRLYFDDQTQWQRLCTAVLDGFAVAWEQLRARRER